MAETEMTLQSDLVEANNPKISSYSKLEIKDEEEESNNANNYDNINNNNIPSLAQIPNNNNIIIINGKTYSVNSDQSRPITHKYFYSKLGNTHTFLADDFGNPLIIIGPHWPMFASVELVFTFFFFFILIYFRKFITTLICLLGFFLYFIFFSCYAITALLNPGYPKQDEETLHNKNKKKTGYCTVCKIWLDLEKKTKHCKFCNICVEGMDHHCPWTGKCIGRRNIIPFYIFLFAVFGLFGYFIFVYVTCKDKLIKQKNK